MNIKLTPFAKLFTISVSLIILFDACSCKTCGTNSDIIEVPQVIMNEIDEYIVDKVGNKFYEKYIHADFLRSKKLETYYEVYYNFRMLEYDFVDEDIVIFADSNGTIIKSKGIPECALSESGCEFTISKDRAIEIGVENGLPEGIKEWAVEFRWSDVVDRYIWHVISTESESGYGEDYKATGKEIMINPLNGDVLKRREWNIL